VIAATNRDPGLSLSPEGRGGGEQERGADLERRVDLLKRSAWLGNLREFENTVERAVVLAAPAR
jgi:transcriptional regulator with AAA-type ATPase domain